MAQVDVFWCGKYRQDWETDPHNHMFFQMIAFTHGSGKIKIEDKSYTISSGQIYLVSPQQTHSIQSSPNDSAHIMDIKFSVNNLHLFSALKDIPYPFISSDFNWFIKKFEKIISESLSQQEYYYALICNILFDMLVHIIRELKGTEIKHISTYEDVKTEIYKGINVQSLLEYIQFNYASIISLDDLIEVAHTNKTTLTVIFKDLFDTTPIKYINSIRMNKAKELLTNTDISIGEIAELTGFQSIHYFSRFFKTREAITPIEYRMTHKENKYFSFE